MEYTQLAFGNDNNALTITIEGPPVPANFKMRFSRISAFSMVDMINELMGQRTAIDDAEVEATKVLVTNTTSINSGNS